MEKIKSLLEQVSSESATASSKSPTAVGRTEAQRSAKADSAQSELGVGEDADAGLDEGFDQVDAINKVFAEFQFAYHNQFHKAFPDAEALVIAKKYWLSSLQDFPPQVIVAAAKQVVATQEYLPSISVMLRACASGRELFGLPDTHQAYLEACGAPSPKRDYRWSHEAVYHAGLACGWFILANEPEQFALPIFSRHYERLCQQVLRGETLRIDPTPALPEKVTTALSTEELQQRLAVLKDSLSKD